MSSPGQRCGAGCGGAGYDRLDAGSRASSRLDHQLHSFLHPHFYFLLSDGSADGPEWMHWGWSGDAAVSAIMGPWNSGMRLAGHEARGMGALTAVPDATIETTSRNYLRDGMKEGVVGV